MLNDLLAFIELLDVVLAQDYHCRLEPLVNIVAPQRRWKNYYSWHALSWEPVDALVVCLCKLPEVKLVEQRPRAIFPGDCNLRVGEQHV